MTHHDLRLAIPSCVQHRSTTRSWILLEDNEADVVEAIGLAQRYNVSELQLSHSIIMDIDEINEDPDRAARIARYVDLIHDAYV